MGITSDAGGFICASTFYNKIHMGKNANLQTCFAAAYKANNKIEQFKIIYVDLCKRICIFLDNEWQYLDIYFIELYIL